MTPLPRFHLSKRNGMNKIQYKHFRQPIETKIMQMRMCYAPICNSCPNL